MRWVGYVTRMGVKRNAYRVHLGSGRDREFLKK
jgi:hypothetical protein